MRVAVVAERTTHLRDTEGRRRVETVARRLADRGEEVRVFCSAWWQGYDVTREEGGVTYHAVTVSPARTSFLARVPALVARYRPDVVVALPEPPAAVASAKVGAAVSRAPLVVDWFGDEDVADEWTLPLATRAADRVVTPSRLVQTDVRELGVPGERTRVVPEPVDFSLVREVDPASTPDVVYARRLDGAANLDDLLLALAELRDRDWSATVFGDGPARETYEERAADLRIADRVTFAGDVPRRERVAAYRGAHVFVQTATRSCFATELLWALASGCVGIVEYQADSAAHELVEARERGFRVSAPEEIADAIRQAGDLPRQSVDESFLDYDEERVLERYRDALVA